MKTKFYILSFLFFFAVVNNSYSQKYKSFADTARMSQEYLQVMQNIADLKAKIEVENTKLTDYESKANSTASSAQKALDASNDQASKAASGDVKDARRAKKKAKAAYKEADNANDVQNDYKDQKRKIEKLNKDLAKKEKRMKQIDDMRASIIAKGV